MRTALFLAGNSGGLIPGKAQQPQEQRPHNGVADDDDVGMHVLGCWVDILGTNCTKHLKLKISVCVGGGGGGREGGGGRFSFRTCNHVREAARRLLLDKKDILSLGVHFTEDKKRRPPAHSCRWACNEGSIHLKLNPSSFR